MCKSNLEYLDVGGERLALHSWVPKHPKAVVFYFHGVQSHAGWSIELGQKLAAAGVVLIILERAGIGLSSGKKGDVASLESLFNSYCAALQIIKQRYSSLPLTLFGQSFGGSILAGLLSWEKFRLDYNAVAFCTPGLGRRHQLLPEKEYKSQLQNRSDSLVPLNLASYDMTDLPQFVYFIENDTHPCREITRRARAVSLELENLYWNKMGIINNKPALFIYAEQDPIVDNSAALKIFRRLTNNSGIELSLKSAKHYLWFTEKRNVLCRWLINFALTAADRRVS